ncbi:MAG: PhnD/SsuA/transferrin family substrate-binding protein [Oscillospiraceae bacterium]|nr:PhnD/SsuA/transferrin family substrate-binding protein [Oscillospiraceae bacterium]
MGASSSTESSASEPAVVSSVTESTSGATSSSSTKKPAASKPVSSAEASSTEPDDILTPAERQLKVVALKGPTAMGLVKMMQDNSTPDSPYEFEILASPDEISPMVAQGSADIFCVPANLAAVLANKTGGKVQAIAINTLGVLYICEKGETVKSIADLKGKTIYSAGKGSTPEYALNFILKSNNIDPEKDVTIEWKSEHAECLEAMLKGTNCVAMLPQPFVTTAQSKNSAVRVAVDLNDAWDALGLDSSLITGAAIVRTELAENDPEKVNIFLQDYEKSVDYVNSKVDEAAELVGKYDIVPEAVAKKAIPECHIVCIYGNQMYDKLSGYLQVLYDTDPKSVGGTLPDRRFYYIGVE